MSEQEKIEGFIFDKPYGWLIVYGVCLLYLAIPLLILLLILGKL